MQTYELHFQIPIRKVGGTQIGPAFWAGKRGTASGDRPSEIGFVRHRTRARKTASNSMAPNSCPGNGRDLSVIIFVKNTTEQHMNLEEQSANRAMPNCSSGIRLQRYECTKAVRIHKELWQRTQTWPLVLGPSMLCATRGQVPYERLRRRKTWSRTPPPSGASSMAPTDKLCTMTYDSWYDYDDDFQSRQRTRLNNT